MTATVRYFTFLAILLAVAFATAFVSGWPFGFIALILFIGWPLIGTLITLDDDLPGGFSNPDGKATPEWKTLNWNLEILLCRGSVVVLAFAFDYREDLALAGGLAIAAAVMALLGFPRIIAALKNQPQTQ